MSAYVLTPLAKVDIFNIWCYIADDSKDAADRVEPALILKPMDAHVPYPARGVICSCSMPSLIL